MFLTVLLFAGKVRRLIRRILIIWASTPEPARRAHRKNCCAMNTTEALHVGHCEQVETLYADHHRWLLGWLYKRLGDSHLAADISHDTFVRVLTKDAPLVIREPRALLNTIASGLVSDFLRHQRIERAYLEALEVQSHAVDISPEQRAIVIDALVQIDRLLDGLPRIVRQAFLMFQLEGLKQGEIAERLGISIPTVKRHVARALAVCSFA